MNQNKYVKATPTLPADYELFQTVDLNKDKKKLVLIQVIFILVALVMVFIAIYFDLPMKNDLPIYLKIGITVVLAFIYMMVHELMHGLFIFILSKDKPTFGFRFPYLTTGSKYYYSKQNFMMILLAPVVILGIILLASLFLIPENLFMSMYIVTGLNFAGSAGDYLQAFMNKGLSKDVLIKDDGLNTTYYRKNTI